MHSRLSETKASILPELIELAKDEECSVRTAAFDALADLISFLEETTLQKQVIPLIKQFSETSYSTGDLALPVVARNLGRLCHELKGMYSI